MTDHLSIDIHEEFNSCRPGYGEIFRESELDRYIYAIFDENRSLIYIGQATQVSSRFKEHCRNFPNAHSCKFYQVNARDVDQIEFELICTYLPPLNKSLPRTENYYTLQDYQSKDCKFHSQKVRVLRIIKELNIKDMHGFYRLKDLIRVSKILEAGGE